MSKHSQLFFRVSESIIFRLAARQAGIAEDNRLRTKLTNTTSKIKGSEINASKGIEALSTESNNHSLSAETK